MSTHLMTANDLLEHAEVFEHIPNIVFGAEAEDEEFENVQVITLQQYYMDKCYEQAWDHVDSGSVEDLEQELTEDAEIICGLNFANGREFVEIHRNHVIIGINAKTITDQEINKALAYLVSVDDFTPGERYEFGEEKRIHYEFASKVSSNSSPESITN